MLKAIFLLRVGKEWYRTPKFPTDEVPPYFVIFIFPGHFPISHHWPTIFSMYSLPSQRSPMPSPSPTLHPPPTPHPIHPTPPILPHPLPPCPLSHPRRRPRPHPRLTIKHQFCLKTRFLPSESLVPFRGTEEEGVGVGGYGQGMGGGNYAGGGFGGFADVD